MKAKEPKVYTLTEVAKAIKVTGRCVRNYVKAGLIHASPGLKRGRTVTEEELLRVKRDGIDNRGLTNKLAQIAKRGGAARSAAKKRVKRDAAGAVTKKQSAYTRKVTKKQVKRNAAAATRAPAKKQAKRGAARKK